MKTRTFLFITLSLFITLICLHIVTERGQKNACSCEAYWETFFFNTKIDIPEGWFFYCTMAHIGVLFCLFFAMFLLWVMLKATDEKFGTGLFKTNAENINCPNVLDNECITPQPKEVENEQ